MLICGVDEVGRGAFLGPICAAAVVIDEDALPGLDVRDSKKLSRSKREAAYDRIIEAAASCIVFPHDVPFIDEHGIQEANRSVMWNAITAAVAGLPPDSEVIAHLDGQSLWAGPCGKVPCRWMTGGEDECKAIAAASILAKVTRDREMVELAEHYPEYGIESHVGYGSLGHIEAILQCGAVPGLHRKQFLRKLQSRGLWWRRD